MRLAIISDIHGNIHALEQVLVDIHQQAPDRLICLGDLVGYGVFPNEVIDTIRDREIPTIMGNYDDGVGYDRDDCGCVYQDAEADRLGKLSLHWSREHVREDNKAYLRALPEQMRETIGEQRVLFVHGSPRRMNEYLYEDRPDATFERIAADADANVILFGHTHLPYTKEIARTLFVNTGSVGKPKDGNPQAGYVLIDFVQASPVVEFRRLDYDVNAAVEAIRSSRMPDHFADVLASGGQ